MPGGVIEVRRPARPGFFERLYLPSLVRALRLGRRRARALASAVMDAPHPGMPVLVADDAGTPRCVACGLCAAACPARCIDLEPGDDPDDSNGRRPVRFDLDMAACLVCGLCEEACPEDAIVMASVPPPPAIRGEALRYDLPSLLVPEALLARAAANPTRAADPEVAS